MEDVAEFVMEYINSDVGFFYSFRIAEITHRLAIGCWNRRN